MATSAFSESSSRNGYIRSGPSEQFSPTENGFTCSTAFQKASMVCAEIIVSPPRPTAAEIMTGSFPLRSSSKTSRIATSAALAFSESKIVSTSSRSDAARHQRPHLLLVSRLHLVEGDHPEARIVGIRRIRQRDRQRPDRSGHKPLPPGRIANAIRPHPALPRRLLVDLPGQLVEKRIFDDLLVELRILPPAVLARIVHKELALRDAGRAKRVRLDDVGARLQKPPMNVADHLRLRQREQVAVVQQVLRARP